MTSEKTWADLTPRIMAYEAGELDEAEVLEFFQDLVAAGLIWRLQGAYQRAAKRLGLLDGPAGEAS